jgi:hypothetical protein
VIILNREGDHSSDVVIKRGQMWSLRGVPLHVSLRIVIDSSY